MSVRCLAAPIRNSSGQVVASIGISGPASRLTDRRFGQMGAVVRNIGIEVSRRLGSMTGYDRR